MKAFVFSIVLASAVQSFASTVGWSATGSALGLANGSLAPQGALVRLGYFTINDSQIQSFALAGDKSGLELAFRQFGTTTVGNSFGLDGVWDASSVNNDIQFVNKSIYYWSYNTSSLASATQWGIYKSTNSAWTFPSDNPNPGSTNIDLSQVNQNSSGLIVGSYGAAAQTPPVGGSNIYKMATVSAIPEPSTMTFGLIALIGMLGMRRRKN